MVLIWPKIKAAVLLLLAAEVAGKSYSNYYPSDLGMYDPNIDRKMYWANPVDIIDDISQFDALYVTHHNCAWSAYEGGCGAETDDDELWYMALSPCFRANAAFSLYGILKGERDRGCNRNTFINSFMTNNGIESFTTAIVDAGISFTQSYNSGNGYPGGVTSACAVISEQGQNNDGGAMLNEYYNSYGVSCSSSGKYVSSFFKGAFCSDIEVIGTKDGLNTFNKEIANIQCVPIYRANERRERALEGDEDGDDGDDIESPLSLLLSSQTCSVAEYPRSCPDPFGKVKSYEKALALATGQRHNMGNERIRSSISWILLMLGTAALSVPLILSRRRKNKRKHGAPLEDDRNVKKRTIWQRFLSGVRKKQRSSVHHVSKINANDPNQVGERQSTTSSLAE